MQTLEFVTAGCTNARVCARTHLLIGLLGHSFFEYLRTNQNFQRVCYVIRRNICSYLPVFCMTCCYGKNQVSRNAFGRNSFRPNRNINILTQYRTVLHCLLHRNLHISSNVVKVVFCKDLASSLHVSVKPDFENT